MVGILWDKVSNLEKGGATATTTTTSAAQTAAAAVSLDTIKGLFSKDVIKFGDVNRKVLFVEIADPSCPYCHVAGGYDPEIAAAMDTQTSRFKYVSEGGTYQPPVPEIKKLVDSGRASFVWIYFPGHTGGEMGAKALYCAFDQGKFWQADQLLRSEKGYEIQNGVDANNSPTKGPIVGNDKTKFAEMADFLKGVLDANQLKTCLSSGKYDARIASETSEGQSFAQYLLFRGKKNSFPKF